MSTLREKLTPWRSNLDPPRSRVRDISSLSAMRAEDFFVETADAGPWGKAQRVLDEELIEQVHAGVGPRADVEVAVPLARLIHDEFESHGTDGNTRLSNLESRGAMAALRAVLARLDVPFTPLFDDFNDFRTYWRRNGAAGSGGWQARRDILSDLLNPVHEQLADLQAGALRSVLAQPVTTHPRTGWTRVDDEIAELRRHFQAARTPQDFRNVGNDCVIVLERLSEAAYVPARHLSEGQDEPPVANTKQRLERVVEVDQTGSSNAELRKLVRAVIEQAQAVKHRTPNRRHAGIAADSVILLANIFRRLAEPED